MEELIDNPKRIIWKQTGDIISCADFDEKTFDEIKDIFDEISVKYPLNKLKLLVWSSDEDHYDFMVFKEEIETDEEYLTRLNREENIRITKENAKKLAEVAEYNNYLKLKEKYEKNE